VTWLLLAACAAVEPAPRADPMAAQAYAEAGETELSAGSFDTAREAFREALRLDPSLLRVREALERICDAEAAPDPFEEGVRLLDAGRPGAALERFEEARRRSPDAGTALMLGICRYELGEDEAARPLLLEAQDDPLTAQSADVFLGLLALRAGNRSEAASRFASAGGSADPRLSAAASELLKLSRRAGRIVVGAAIDPRFDTNVALASDAEARADGAAVAAVNVSSRPLGWGRGLYVNANLLYRQQFSARDYDFAGAGGAAGWEWSRPALAASLEYGAEAYALGGSLYLLAQRLTASAHWTPGRLSLGGSYRLRPEDFRASGWESYSGYRHTAGLDASWHFDGGSSLALSWRGERHDAFSAALSDWETGPWILCLWRAGADVRAGVQAGVLRRWDDADETGTSLRDMYLHGEAFAEYDLGTQWVLRAGVGAYRTASQAQGGSYGNVFASVGVAWARGFF